MHEAVRNAEGQVAKEVAELAANEAPARIESDLAHMVLMLHEDLLKAFRALSLHASEYADRLRDEVRLGELARAVEAYYAEQPLLRVMMAMVQIQLLWLSVAGVKCRHYQTERMHAQLWAAVHPEQPAESVLARVAACCATVYREGTAYQQQTAALYHIICLCLHDQFQRARDLLLMARLQERVQAGDQALMILFNRAMTQLGLAAFRAGSMVYAHNCLDDLVNVGSRNGLLRVLLGQQGSQGSQSAQSEEEMVVPAKRVVPAHMVSLSKRSEA